MVNICHGRSLIHPKQRSPRFNGTGETEVDICGLWQMKCRRNIWVSGRKYRERTRFEGHGGC
ncbi:hypothetical protein ZOSMA_224G00370 [Zostera marina]|uniref:Uncharacterized protein n=1 Tax=Zostera marina TaxID=29655 RepID=A0A0K9PL81_ZOSMR|nr:hypothetical protein ZOSMA_224G00370 [Zostera marina]